MAVITNYNTLIQAVKDLAEDDGQEFSDYLPTAIDLAEERLFRELELPDIEDKEFGTLTPNSAGLLKPTNYEFAAYFTIDVAGRKRNLLKRTESFVNDYWPDSTVTDVPKYYCDANSAAFKLAPTPESNYPYEIKYTKKPTKLSSTNATNYFTDSCKDLLFSATMLEMVKFMKSWSQIPVWEQTYNTQRESWNVQMMRFRRDENETPTVTASGPNTLKHTITSNA
jgi:hypothetical protein